MFNTRDVFESAPPPGTTGRGLGDGQQKANLRGNEPESALAAIVHSLPYDKNIHAQIDGYLSGALKTGALFLRGSSPFGNALAVGGTMLVYALDEWKPGEHQGKPTNDLLLGALKGAATKSVFHYAGEMPAVMKLLPQTLNLPARALFLGEGARAADVFLSAKTWSDAKDTRTDHPLRSIAGGLANPAAIAGDACAYTVSAGLLKGAHLVSGDLIKRSPLLSTMIVGTGYGITSGATGEYAEEKKHGVFDPLKIAQKAAIQGGVDALASAPGGMQSENQAIALFKEINIPAQAQTPFSGLKTCASGIRNHIVETNTMRTDLAPEFSRGAAACFMKDTKALPAEAFSISPEGEGTPESRLARVHNAHASINTYHYLHKIAGHDFAVATSGKYLKLSEEARTNTLNNLHIATENESPFRTRFIVQHRRNDFMTPLVEDLMPYFDGLPNSRLVGMFGVSEFRHPDDPLAIGFVPNGTNHIWLYPMRADQLHETVNHEWSHVLHNTLSGQLENYYHALAGEKLSKNFWVADDYARQNHKEDFAVHMSKALLGFDGKAFLECLEKAPLRSIVLGRCLNWSLNEAPQAEISHYREAYKARADFIKKYILQQSQERLIKEIKKDPAPDKLAALASIGSPEQIKYFQKALRDPQNADNAKSILKSGLRLLGGNPEKQFDFLFEASNPRLAERHLVTEHYTKEMIESYFVPRLKKMEAKLKKDDPLLLGRREELADWYKMFSKQGHFEKPRQARQ